MSGHGDGPASAGLNPKPASFADNAFKYDANGNGTKGDIDDIKAIVHDGAAKHGGSPLMTPWPMLSPEQLQAVAEYVKGVQRVLSRRRRQPSLARSICTSPNARSAKPASQ